MCRQPFLPRFHLGLPGLSSLLLLKCLLLVIFQMSDPFAMLLISDSLKSLFLCDFDLSPPMIYTYTSKTSTHILSLSLCLISRFPGEGDLAVGAGGGISGLLNWGQEGGVIIVLKATSSLSVRREVMVGISSC